MTIVCKHCGAKDGFYTRERITGTASVNYTNKGDYAFENGQIYDYLNHSGGKLAYCIECNKSIGKSESLKSGMIEEDRSFH